MSPGAPADAGDDVVYGDDGNDEITVRGGSDLVFGGDGTDPSGTLVSDGDDEFIEEIVTTGTRIRNENLVAASPVTTIGEEEINLKQTPNIERVFRDLPITIPGDGENVNNGTAGQATLDLRGLGPERSLILIDGKRLATRTNALALRTLREAGTSPSDIRAILPEPA